MKRDEWLCLNGVWDYAIGDSASSEPERYDGDIVVPFSPESLLSGVGRQLRPGQTLWYKRAVRFENVNGRRLLLHFGAVDQCCTVYVNSEAAGTHEGGYWPFYFDITALLRDGDNTLVLSVKDDSDTGDQAYGKQKLRRGGIWYTAQSGIWQTVWAEYVPEDYIRCVRITPRPQDSAVDFDIDWTGQALPEGHIRVYEDGRLAAQAHITGTKASLELDSFRCWSPDAPFLYTVRIEAGADAVESYFGMRAFGTARGADGHLRLTLNGEPVLHNGLLDQGYWSDGLYTAPSDEAMVWELSRIKKMGFNMLRKHIKIEPMRWYYHCDRLGILVWQDFVSGGGPYKKAVVEYAPWLGLRFGDGEKKYALHGRQSKAGRDIFVRDARRTVDLLYNAVSLAVWVPFNEGWGQFDAGAMCRLVRQLDPTRHVDHASGYHDQGAGDFQSYHIYYKKFRPKRDRRPGRVLALTEFGGFSLPSDGHMATPDLFGYRIYQTQQELEEAVEALFDRDVLPNIPKGLSAIVYTQVSDVEDEINGLFTFDREKVKVNDSRILATNEKLYDAFGKNSDHCGRSNVII
jgi:hypothetical protein